ncbi:MAG TPA: hypothetical protein VFQ39_09665 [Longimicrobium sp.]|nr:hypothetical protein [Longimicrobium sp.]
MDTVTLRTYVAYAMMAVLFACAGAAIVGVISPQTVKMRSRAKAFFGFGFLAFVTLIVIGVVAPPEMVAPPVASDSTGSASALLDTTGMVGTDGGSGGVSLEPAEPMEATAVLRSDSGSVNVSSSRTRRDQPSLVAQLPPGTEVVVLSREYVGQLERCQVKTTFAPLVTGWVDCASIRE